MSKPVIQINHDLLRTGMGKVKCQ